KMPAFEWVHVQLHQQKGMISLSPPTICNSADFDTFRDAWWGEADSEEAFAVEFASDTGLLADVPETVALYFDYEAYARDLFLDSFTFIDGHVFRR
ncbi:antirestriction protein ArdA, partial [Klebsiella pneumoniae]|uniref:antirestriction protein ArdA n=1 Tax=Klebsiella pneumoniae TaxID=573 RepID=UPI002159F9B0